MLEVMKDIVEKRFEHILRQIETSSSQSHTIDISIEFLEMMSRNIITVAFGEDVNDELFELKMRKTPDGSDFESRKVNLTTGISECWEQTFKTYGGKLANPLRTVGLCDFTTNFTSY